MKTATIKQIEKLTSETKVFYLECSEPLNFTGGNWILVRSNILKENPKDENDVYKRSYSICSSDRNQKEFTLIIKIINQHRVSGYLHSLKVGDAIQFSGPYGKEFRWFESDPTGKYLFIATHTGITAILGILNSEYFLFKVKTFDFFWVLPNGDENYFIPPNRIHSFIENISPNDFAFTIIPESSDFFSNNLDLIHSYDGIFIAGKKDIINQFENTINKEKVVFRTEYFF
jgi:NAD(P)H-flavin reductase